MDNRDKLLAIMKEFSLEQSQVADITGYSTDSVKGWTTPNRDSKRARPVPDRAIKILQLSLGVDESTGD